MRGTTFQKPLEFKLFVNGESWQQGDSVSGTITVASHSDGKESLKDIKLMLALGAERKVKSKAADAFTVISEISLKSPPSVDAKKDTGELKWTVDLDANCAITDTAGSLYLLYGHGKTEQLGHLQLHVQPKKFFTDFAEVFEIQHRFAQKYKKSKKGKVEIKLAPPVGKQFAAMDQLYLLFRMDGETLEVNYLFNVKKLDAATMKLRKEKIAFEQSFQPNEYRLFNGRLNKLFIEEKVQGILGELKSGMI